MTDPQCIFYGGKGGVGKTTCAAATGLGLAAAGYETLVVSTDPAHSLSDAYEVDVDAEPREIGTDLGVGDAERPQAAGLWAVEIDPESRAERYERLATALASDLRAAGISFSEDDVREVFAGGAPAGSDELAALDLLVEYVEDGTWDRIVFDTAPTGHTLRLLSLPDALGRGLETLRSLRGQVRRIGDSAKRVMLGPMYYATGRSGDAGDGADELVALRDRFERARELLVDPERTTFRVVLVPETMAIAESERLVDRLVEGDIPVGALVVNRVFEAADEACSRCRSRRARHERRLAEIRERFPDHEVYTVPDAEGEGHGRETLVAVAERLPR